MRKTRIVGFALTLAATMVVGGAMGQVAGGSNFVKVGTATDEGDASNPRSYITTGATLGFYAEPDKAFHPGYTSTNAPTAWFLTPGFTWTWTVTGVTVTKGPAITPVAKPENYVELTSTNLGVHNVKVYEEAPASFGGCKGADRSFDLVVMDKPTMTIDADVVPPVATSTVAGTNNRSASAVGCGDLTNWNVNFTISAAEYINTQVTLEEFKVTINPSDGTKTIAAAPRTSFIYDIRNQSITSTSAAATLATAVPASAQYTGWNNAWNVKAGANFSYTTTDANRADISLKHTRDFKVYVDGTTPANSDVITLYRYTVGGVNDFVTRKSEGITNNTTLGTMYDKSVAGSKVVEIYVKRAPVTGPVYHINNNVAK
jgi:hypothetical protein